MPVIPRTATASVAWENQMPKLNVYTQDPDGYVRESQWNGKDWIAGTRRNRHFLAKKNTPLAAFGIQPNSTTEPNIRLYWVDANDLLQEYSYDLGRGWYRGEVSSFNIQVHPQSKLAACVWGKYQCIYYQHETNTDTMELKWDGASWVLKRLPAKAKLGSPLTACYLNGGPRIFYLTDDDYIREQIFDSNDSNDSKWIPGPLVYPAPAGTYFAAITTGQQIISLYLLWPKGEIAESKWDTSVGKWSLPLIITYGMLGTTLSACTPLIMNGNFKRVYFQVEQNAVVEHCNDGGDWYRGAGVPTKDTVDE